MNTVKMETIISNIQNAISSGNHDMVAELLCSLKGRCLAASEVEILFDLTENLCDWIDVLTEDLEAEVFAPFVQRYGAYMDTMRDDDTIDFIPIEIEDFLSGEEVDEAIERAIYEKEMWEEHQWYIRARQLGYE